METINFECNFNNKIECIFFTSIRIKSDKYKEGEEYEIMLRSIPIKTAKISSIKEIKLENISEFIAGIDMGYSIYEIRKYFQTVYKNVNWEKQIMYLMLLETTNVY